jgi:hypothetical protein
MRMNEPPTNEATAIGPPTSTTDVREGIVLLVVGTAIGSSIAQGRSIDVVEGVGA